jgi:hypothetical protein
VLVTVPELAAVLSLDLAPDDLDAGQVCAAADAAVRDRLVTVLPDGSTPDHDTHPNDREAALAVAVQVWQARQAPGGQMVGPDLVPYAAPHLLGPGLQARILGLISPCAIGRRPTVG